MQFTQVTTKTNYNIKKWWTKKKKQQQPEPLRFSRVRINSTEHGKKRLIKVSVSATFESVTGWKHKIKLSSFPEKKKKKWRNVIISDKVMCLNVVI